jgi:hypothetical protein
MFVGFYATERISTQPSKSHSRAYFGMLTILIPVLLKSSAPCKYRKLHRWCSPRRRKREGWFKDTNTAKYRPQPASRLSMVFLKITRLPSCNNNGRFVHISAIFRHATPSVSSPAATRRRAVLIPVSPAKPRRWTKPQVVHAGKSYSPQARYPKRQSRCGCIKCERRGRKEHSGRYAMPTSLLCMSYGLTTV